MFLILHKVRGEPAFDIAEKWQCPECSEGCDECDMMGYWWICSTSGHRARPYKWWPVADLGVFHDVGVHDPITVEPLPAHWPDHYRLNKAPKPDTADLLAKLTAHLPKPAPFKRRI